MKVTFGATIESACALTRPDAPPHDEEELLRQAHAKKKDETADLSSSAVISFPQALSFLPLPVEEAPCTGGQSGDRADALAASVDAGTGLPEGALASLSLNAHMPGEDAASGGLVQTGGAAAPESFREATPSDARAKAAARLFSRIGEDWGSKEKAPPSGPADAHAKAPARFFSPIEDSDAKESTSGITSADARADIALHKPFQEGFPADGRSAQVSHDEITSATVPRAEMRIAPTQEPESGRVEKAAPRSENCPPRTEEIAVPAETALAQGDATGKSQGAAHSAERAQTAQANAPHAAPEPSASAQLARSTANALARGESQFHLRLRPEGMGEVAVTIRAKERELSLDIRASSGETRELILSQIDDLKGGLAASEYRLGELSVEVNASGHEGAAFSTFAQEQGNREAPRQPVKAPPIAAATKSDRIIPTHRGAIMYRI